MQSATQVLRKLFQFSSVFQHQYRPQTKQVARKERTQAVACLPGVSEFRAVLADEYRKVAHSQGNLAVEFLKLPDCAPQQRDTIANFLFGLKGNNQTVFLLSQNCFALIAPGMGSVAAALFSLEMLNSLRINFPETRVTLNLAAYPENAKTFEELEAAAPCDISK